MPIGTATALAIAASAASGIGSAALNKPKPSTSTSSSTSNYNNTSSSKRDLTPEQEQQRTLLGETAMDQVTNAAGRLEPLRQVTKAQVNKNYAGADEAIRAKLGRSGAASGKLGTATRQTELSRIGGLSGVDTQWSSNILNEQERGTSLMERLLSQNYGQTQTNSGTQTSSGQGTNTAAPIGGMGIASNAINSGLDTATTLMMINAMLKPQGGSYNSPYSPQPYNTSPQAINNALPVPKAPTPYVVEPTGTW